MSSPRCKYSKLRVLPVISVPANLYDLESVSDSNDTDVCSIDPNDFEFPLDFGRSGNNKNLYKSASLVIKTSDGTVASMPIVGLHDYRQRLIISHEFMDEMGLVANSSVEVIGVMVDGLIDGMRLEKLYGRFS